MAIGKKVLVTATNYSALCQDAKKELEAQGLTVIENPYDRPMTAEELTDCIPDVDAVIAGVDTWNESVFQMAKRLKVIARFGVGIDNIDVKKAHQYGIKVTNAPRLNANAVAELTVGLIFSLLRNIPSLNQTTKQGKWERFVGGELNGKTVGLLGFGNIPQKVAQKLQGFEICLLAFDKYPNLSKAKQYGVEMASLEDVIRQSDIVCMHLPSLEETHHTMNDHRFRLMKASTYFINTARGALVDEKALYRALRTGKLAAAAIDVYEEEPAASDHPLFRLPNVITTPHTAAETYDTYKKVGLVTAGAVIDVLSGREPENLIRPD